jgi:DNA-binding NarL/FixJ family response regulator
MHAPSERPAHVIHVEDCPDDVELVAAALRRAGIAALLHRVQSEAGLREALDERMPDLVLCDYHLPGFSAGRALEVLREKRSPAPVVVVSRHMNDEEWAALARQGARARVDKGRLGDLAPAVRAALGTETACDGSHASPVSARSG